MRVIYVAGPYRAVRAWTREQNIRRAEQLAFQVAEIGAVPLCPHAMYRYFDGTLSDYFWLEATMRLLDRCDAAIFVDGWIQSLGSRAERRRAEVLEIPVFDSIEELRGRIYALEARVVAPPEGSP